MAVVGNPAACPRNFGETTFVSRKQAQADGTLDGAADTRA
jgi:hypothetical protein